MSYRPSLRLMCQYNIKFHITMKLTLNLKGVKVTRETFHYVDFNEIIMTKKLRRVIRKLFMEVIFSECPVKPRSSNKY